MGVNIGLDIFFDIGINCYVATINKNRGIIAYNGVGLIMTDSNSDCAGEVRTFCRRLFLVGGVRDACGLGAGIGERSPRPCRSITAGVLLHVYQRRLLFVQLGRHADVVFIGCKQFARSIILIRG